VIPRYCNRWTTTASTASTTTRPTSIAGLVAAHPVSAGRITTHIRAVRGLVHYLSIYKKRTLSTECYELYRDHFGG